MKDAFGTELKIGDTVVYAQKGYRHLSKGVIKEFTPKMARLSNGYLKESEFIMKVPIVPDDSVVLSHKTYATINKAANHLWYLQGLGVDNWGEYSTPEFDADGDIVEEQEEEDE